MGDQYSENKNESFSKTIGDIIRQKYDLAAEDCGTISVGEDECNFVQDCTSYEEFLSDLLKDDNNLLYYKHFHHGVSDGPFNVCEFPTTQPSKEIHVVADEKVEFNINTVPPTKQIINSVIPPPQVPPPEENINYASHVTFIIDDTEVELEVIQDLITSVEIQEKKI